MPRVPRRIRLENGLSGSTEYQRRGDVMMNRRGGSYWRIRDLDGVGWHWRRRPKPADAF